MESRSSWLARSFPTQSRWSAVTILRCMTNIQNLVLSYGTSVAEV